MERNDDILIGEVNTFVSSLQKLLPKKKTMLPFVQEKLNLTRLNNVHAESKSVFPQCFIGAKLVIFREVIDRIKLVQQYTFGKPKDPYLCYSHIIHKELEQIKEDGLLVDASGSATATYRENLDGPYEIRLTSKIKDLVSSENEVTIERENETSVSSLSLSMRDVEPGSLKVVSQWMYRVMPDFYLGTELNLKPLMYPPVPELSLSVRYERPTYILSSTINKAGLQACFFKRFSKDLRLATIVNEGSFGGPASVGVALHKKMSNGTELKMFVDSMRCGGFTVQRDISITETQNEDRVLRLVASTLIDRHRRVRFGFGFNLDF